MDHQDTQAQFEALFLPHLDAAYNLARWLTRNEHDAQDVVQESCLRAFKFFGGFHGGNGRSWLLSIVRNTAYSWLQKNRRHKFVADCDGELQDVEDPAADTEAIVLRQASREVLMQALDELPLEYREVAILRELEGMSYKEIAEVTSAPIGTVMSRLARARKQLQKTLIKRLGMGDPR